MDVNLPNEVSQTIRQSEELCGIRSARSFNCRAPLLPIYTILFCQADEVRFAAPKWICSIPGSPPSRTSDPGTKPPPNTRFSSSSCISIRGSSSGNVIQCDRLAFYGFQAGYRSLFAGSLRIISSTYVPCTARRTFPYLFENPAHSWCIHIQSFPLPYSLRDN